MWNLRKKVRLKLCYCYTLHLDVAVGLLVARGHLQRRVHALEGEVEEQRRGGLIPRPDDVLGTRGEQLRAVLAARPGGHGLVLPPVVSRGAGRGLGHPGVLVVVLAARPVAVVGVEASPGSGEVISVPRSWLAGRHLVGR